LPALLSSQPSQIRRPSPAQPKAAFASLRSLPMEGAVGVFGLGAPVEEVEVDLARPDRDAEENLTLAETVEAALDLSLDQFRRA
jgi:hypothetical protein